MAPTLQFCTFYLDNLLFGVELTGVQEVIRYLGMTRVPLAPDVVSGMHVLDTEKACQAMETSEAVGIQV